jgi:hypothetical protein
MIGMADLSAGEATTAFLKLFRETARYKHRYDVFRDFVIMAACSLHNSMLHDVNLEQEYLEVINTYDQEDQHRFPHLLAHLVTILESEPRDVLGPLYMELEIASKDVGQFFTPPDLSELMARMTFAGELDKLETQPFITVGEPAAGAGGMILALVKVMITAGHNPAEKLWVQCIDIDRLAALMCYVQLSLWNVPAEVIVGDTLRWEHREIWYTPAHYLGNWTAKLAAKTTVGSAPADLENIQEGGETARHDPRSQLKNYERYQMTWKGQDLQLRWCPNWSTDPEYGHLEVITEDRAPHPLSETGYKSHFPSRREVEEMGGPLVYATAWLTEKDDGKPVQLSLF